MSDAPRDLLAELPRAIADGQLVAFYQPQFDIPTGRIVSAEALARWQHPQLGLVPPGTFIPLAEEAGLINDVGDHMIRTACTAAAEWTSAGLPVEVAVNVSGTQLRDPLFAERVLDTVNSVELDPKLLIIEVTESTAVLDVSVVADRLDWLRSVGVTISVDDFGTGHSSVEQILGLRATELKIDQSLVQDESPSAHTLLAAVVSFAQDKGLRVVAEGIETDAQLQRVRDLHCDRAQGYLLGRPVAKAEFDSLLSAANS
jgi:EAL domain-containing protein (putative c-di-GMP-specific phosphodiesterase class I)